MIAIESLRNKLKTLILAANRYPLTMLFLLAVATVNVNSINLGMEDYSKYLFTFIIGALLSAVGQQIYERFYTKMSERIILMGVVVLLSTLYYFSIRSSSVFSMENGTKTAVMIFALTMVFIWGPTIKSKITFNESFMSVFKAFFTTVLFTAVIAGGVSSIIFAIDRLLFTVDNKAIPHALNLILSLFAPTFFLSLTPLYPGKMDTSLTNEELVLREEKIKKAISCPKYLGILISYIIIPLTVVYTVILLIYVLINIRGQFWTGNLLEPMLVSYAITVILVYILASNLNNSFTSPFRKIFPKILLPIVLFQTIASFLKINELGVTHGRYYVILFGVFAFITGLIFSFLPIRKNGLFVAVLLIFSVISITPPIDAFTVSRVNQTNLLVKTLKENNMLENNTILPNANVSTEDKKIITRTVSYLNSMNYADEIEWLPNKVFFYDNFKKTFGFDEVYDQPIGGGTQSWFAYLDWERSPVVNIEGHDFMIHMNISSSQAGKTGEQAISLERNGMRYTLMKQRHWDYFTISVMSEDNEELIQFDTKEIFNHIFENDQESNEGKGNMLTVEKATLTKENDKMKMTVLVNSIDAFDSQYNADFYVFLNIK
ncbi:DUF4153 domain-containing protein [Bacillus sp. FJAT-29790]|uniref:DUF4153 domain-containing protein n=1 Tax=Bacillus sp. FJAT-29790 TaxID=1895002 RepID=UPI0020B3B9F0|nr:DUF4153 domain-containing protein [Bacillus sp. FJAT-29790]